MAAILCKGMGDLCNGVCKLITLPCRLCCKISCDICTNPFSIFVIAALGFNIPPIVTGASDYINGGCHGTIWTLVHLILCAINIAAAFYIACKYQNGGDSETEQRSGFGRANYILCHDPVVALYILAFIGFFVWLCIGINDCVTDEIALGFSYIGVGIFALSISVCCSCCNGGYQDNNVYHLPTQNNASTNNNTSNGMQQNDVESNDSHNAGNAFPVATPVQEPIAAEVVPEPSAPPMPQGAKSTKDSLKESTAAASGSAFGGKIGKLFSASDKTKARLQSGGAKAGLAFHKTIEGVKKMVK